MHEGVQNLANESNEPSVLVRLYEVVAVTVSASITPKALLRSRHNSLSLWAIVITMMAV